MPSSPVWTLSVDEHEAEVYVDGFPAIGASEEMAVYPIIGRRDPRVLASGNVVSEVEHKLATLTDHDDDEMLAICESLKVVTMTPTGIDVAIDYVRIKSWSRVSHPAGYVMYEIETVRAV